MLVSAAPRPPESQVVLAEMGATITENVLDSSYMKIILLNTPIDHKSLVPLSSLTSARARHREKVGTYTLLLIFLIKPGSCKI